MFGLWGLKLDFAINRQFLEEAKEHGGGFARQARPWYKAGMGMGSECGFEMWLLRRFAANGGDLLISKQADSGPFARQSGADGLCSGERADWDLSEMLKKMRQGGAAQWDQKEGFKDFRYAPDCFGGRIRVVFRVNVHKGPGFWSICMRLVSFDGREEALALIEASDLEKCLESQGGAQACAGRSGRRL